MSQGQEQAAKWVTRRRTVTGLLTASSMALAGLLVPATGTAAAEQAAAMVAVNHARRAGLHARSITWGAAPVDYNVDGSQDVLVNYHGLGAKLWRNDAGRYTRVAKAAWPSENARGQKIDRHNCAWADVDLNGRPDAYCSTGRTRLNIVKRGRDNELWLQSRRGRFREVGTAWHAGDVCGRGRVVVFLDANGDAYPDLFVGNQGGRTGADPCNWSRRLPNEASKILINVGGTRFRYSPRYWNYGAGPGRRCAEVIDVNADGWDDLFTCRAGGSPPRLYLNEQGNGFADVTAQHRLDWWVSDATVADVDGDLDPDVVTAGPKGFGYHLNTDGQLGARTLFAPTPPHLGRSVAVADADADGDSDIYGMVSGRNRNVDDWVWLNDDLTFTRVRVPSADGVADDVTALDPRGNGRAAFLALNGRNRGPRGPVQLIRVLER
jgi:FG-GAP-like repeat